MPWPVASSMRTCQSPATGAAPTEYVRTTSGVPSASTSIDLLPLSAASAGIAVSVVHCGPDGGAVVGAIVAGEVGGGALLTAGWVLGGAGALVTGTVGVVD